MMTMASYDRAVKIRDEAALLNPAPAVQVAPAVVRVPALDWASAILGRYRTVADERQVTHANCLMNEDCLTTLRIVAIGPDFDELDARLAALKAPAVAEQTSQNEVSAPAIDAPAATLILKIGTVAYDLAVLKVAPVMGTAGFRLVKRSGDKSVSDVLVSDHGAECSCGDFTFRHADHGTYCRHLKALAAVGLIAAAPAEPRKNISEVPAPCCPADDPAPCLGCEAEGVHNLDSPSHGFASDLMEAIGLPPIESPRDPQPDDEDRDGAEDGIAPEGCWTAGEIAEGVTSNDTLADESDPLAEWVRPVRKVTHLLSTPAGPKPVKVPSLPDGRYDLASLIDGQAALFNGMGSAPYALMGKALADLAAAVRFVGATTVAEAEGRLREMEDARLYDAFASGFAQAEAQSLADSL